VGQQLLRFPAKAGSDAYSGATVAEFNRVPFKIPLTTGTCN